MCTTKVLLIVFSLSVPINSILIKPPASVEIPNCEYEDAVHLNLSNTGIHHVPKSFLRSAMVTCISLENNAISEIDDGAFGDFSRLNYLNLRNNSFLVRYATLGGAYPALETLILDQTRDTNYYSCLDPFCSFNGLTEIIAPRLQRLYFRQNGIDRILWGDMPNLKQLYLSNNALKTMCDRSPSSFNESRIIEDTCPWLGLTHLHVDHNKLHQLDSSSLPNLQELILSHNELTRIRTDPQFGLYVKQNFNLRKLVVDNNRIARIVKGALTNLTKLQYLDLSFNWLGDIPGNDFTYLENLNALLLNNNRFKSAPKLSGLRNLEFLLLSNNKITEVFSGTFDNLPALKELDLSNNELVACAENWISSLTHLRKLLLNSNKFNDVAEISLNAAYELQYVNLINNPFNNITVEALMSGPENNLIDLKRNNVSMDNQ